MKLLVTGGAGYIGSHVVKLLGEKGHQLLVYDNLSTGHEWSLLYGDLVVGDLADTTMLAAAMKSFAPDAVMHFAASIEVAESVRAPLKYYRNNAANALNLLEAMALHGTDMMIFSSTAAVYGLPGVVPIPEAAPLSPINPYGASKAMIERMLADAGAASSLRSVSLRYFNAAGADPAARIGECHTPESHLIPLVLQAAAGRRERVLIYGTDYPTPDGTCVRDYIHVEDLAAAHLVALDHLVQGGSSRIYNCGYGHGYSVREVVETARKVTGIDLLVEAVGRRLGDPPVLVADNCLLSDELGWTPRHDDLEFIVKTAWEWERKQG